MSYLKVHDRIGLSVIRIPGERDLDVHGGDIFEFNDKAKGADLVKARLIEHAHCSIPTTSDWIKYKRILRARGMPIPKHVMDNAPDEAAVEAAPGRAPKPGELTADNDAPDLDRFVESSLAALTECKTLDQLGVVLDQAIGAKSPIVAAQKAVTDLPKAEQKAEAQRLQAMLAKLEDFSEARAKIIQPPR